ncbi:MAG: DUF1572 family protein [Bacteroidota bacterium]
MSTYYLQSAIKQFQYYKMLGERAMAQVPEEKLFWQHNSDSNSIATIVRHLAGNMLSRWTDFLTTDGEKKWRNRDDEFENTIQTRNELLKVWSEGWHICLQTLRTLDECDLEKTIYIRNQGHTVVEAINRQLAHYPYHIGQIVFIAKMFAPHWETLSIPKGNSKSYNEAKFRQPQHRKHFTDEYLSDDKQGERN